MVATTNYLRVAIAFYLTTTRLKVGVVLNGNGIQEKGMSDTGARCSHCYATPKKIMTMHNYYDAPPPRIFKNLEFRMREFRITSPLKRIGLTQRKNFLFILLKEEAFKHNFSVMISRKKECLTREQDAPTVVLRQKNNGNAQPLRCTTTKAGKILILFLFYHVLLCNRCCY
ncbi:MAG: hypothetical protein SWX82_00685 [Cyanobacteriota bacterium]|nr:hypothetical protein [Cyanobacteriota bacterium]